MNAQGDPVFSWQHLIILISLLTPFLLFWWDTRRQARKMHDETQNLNMTMHRENQNRLVKIETQLQPVYDWWLRTR